MSFRRVFLMLSLLTTPVLVLAQPPMSVITSGPTTRVLAIGRLAAGVTPEKLRPVMPAEVRETVKLYLAGKLDQWFVRRDQRGVVFLMNVSTVEEARGLLEKLPLGVQSLMEFELIPLGPLTPLNFLLPQ